MLGSATPGGLHAQTQKTATKQRKQASNNGAHPRDSTAQRKDGHPSKYSTEMYV